MSADVGGETESRCKRRCRPKFYTRYETGAGVDFSRLVGVEMEETKFASDPLCCHAYS